MLNRFAALLFSLAVCLGCTGPAYAQSGSIALSVVELPCISTPPPGWPIKICDMKGKVDFIVQLKNVGASDVVNIQIAASSINYPGGVIVLTVSPTQLVGIPPANSRYARVTSEALPYSGPCSTEIMATGYTLSGTKLTTKMVVVFDSIKAN